MREVQLISVLAVAYFDFLTRALRRLAMAGLNCLKRAVTINFWVVAPRSLPLQPASDFVDGGERAIQIDVQRVVGNVVNETSQGGESSAVVRANRAP